MNQRQTRSIEPRARARQATYHRDEAAGSRRSIESLDPSGRASSAQLAHAHDAFAAAHDAVAHANQAIYGDAPVQPVQRRASARAVDDRQVHAAAERGTRGGGGALPFRDRIQASFGRHDVSSVRAHVGGQAREASDAMGAEAYASGSAVAFRAAPGLHTAAHEAAHIVQQRGGVALHGGVGRRGDRYEQHADAVADAVVAGRSAESVLDRMVGGGASSGVQRSVVQRLEKPAWFDKLTQAEKISFGLYRRQGMGDEQILEIFRQARLAQQAKSSASAALRQLLTKIAQVAQDRWAAAAPGTKAELELKAPVTLYVSPKVDLTIGLKLSIEKLAKGCKLSGEISAAISVGLPFLKQMFADLKGEVNVTCGISASGNSPQHCFQLITLGIYNRMATLHEGVAKWIFGDAFGRGFSFDADDSVETTVGMGVGIEAGAAGGTIKASAGATWKQTTDAGHRSPRGATTTTTVKLSGSSGPYTGEGTLTWENGGWSLKASGKLDATKINLTPPQLAKAMTSMQNGFAQSAAKAAATIKALSDKVVPAKGKQMAVALLSKIGPKMPKVTMTPQGVREVSLVVEVKVDSRGHETGSIALEAQVGAGVPLAVSVPNGPSASLKVNRVEKLAKDIKFG